MRNYIVNYSAALPLRAKRIYKELALSGIFNPLRANLRNLGIMYDICYFSVKMTCTMVCPTALSTFLSMLSMLSARVCHVGPKELC